MKPDRFHNWLTKSEAAALLERSEKTIERLIEKGKIERGEIVRDGRRQPVYNPRDIEELRKKPSQTPRVYSAEESQAIARPQPPPAQTALAPRVDPRLLEAFALNQGLPRIKEKIFLTVKEAAVYAGLPASLIRRLIRSKKLPAVKAGGWRVKREDLEKLDSRQLR